MSIAFPFLRLPLELREAVYSEYFNPASRLTNCIHGGCQYRFEFSLYQVNKQIFSEAENVFRRENVFVRIETPWPTAVNHISQDGLVPIVASGTQGNKFKRHNQSIEISAPIHQANPEHVIVMLLEDLPSFCEAWFYYSLSYPALNHHLRTRFTLQDPWYGADPKPIPLALQSKLLLPFEKIKGLYKVEFDGYDESVKHELEERMAKPKDTVQKCCEDCVDSMEAGDRELAAGNPEAAMVSYLQAFRDIHIVVAGRTRRVLADPFFQQVIEEGRFSGQTGTTVRIMMRIKLVSRTIAVLIKLQQWEEAAFWGMRSIRIMREAREFEFKHFLTDTAGAQDVGLLYLRTGIAMRKMEDNQSAELMHYGGWNGDEGSAMLFPHARTYMKGTSLAMAKMELAQCGLEVPKSFEKNEKDQDADSLRHLNHDEDSDGDGETETEVSINI